MTHHLKTLPAYFQPITEDKKLFEIRKNDRGFKPGDHCILEEYEGKEHMPGCPAINVCHYGELDINGQPIDPARYNCDLHCRDYMREIYTGRRCLVVINDIYDLTAAGLPGYVAFTFTIKNKQITRSR